MEFLLELRTEELPASHIRSALGQLEAAFRRELAEARIEFRSLRTVSYTHLTLPTKRIV